MFHCRDSSITSLQVGMFTELLRLCCADQYTVDGGVELRHDALPFLERHVALDHKYGTVRKTFAETALVKVECGYGRAADSHFAGYFRTSLSMYLVLFGIPSPE